MNWLYLHVHCPVYETFWQTDVVHKTNKKPSKQTNNQTNKQTNKTHTGGGQTNTYDMLYHDIFQIAGNRSMVTETSLPKSG